MNVKKPFQQGALIVMLLALILYLPAEVFPGTTGKIAGRLLDAQTGDPLPGANVVVQGTTLGAATDIEGYYTILRMPPGTYILEITMIGYKRIIHTNVMVSVDLTTTQNFSLEATVIEGAEITTTAERPLVIKDLTSSSFRVTADEIEDIPGVNSVTDAVRLMPGVIGEGEELHVRGGRSGETVYLIDGIAVNDPLFNNEVIDVNKYAIDEIELQTGGFNAEYGNVQSGLVNIVPRGGRSYYSGRIAYFTDNFGSGDFPSDILLNAEDPFSVDPEAYLKPKGTGLRANSFHSDRWEMNFGGPVPLIGDKLKFFVSATANRSDGYLPNEDQSATLTTFTENFDASADPDQTPQQAGEADATTFSNSGKVDHPFVSSFLGLFDWGGRFSNALNYSAVLNYVPGANYRASVTFVGSKSWGDDYRHTFKFQPDHTQQFEATNSSTVFSWTHTLSPSTFYEAKFAYTRNNRLQYPGMRNGIRLTPEFMNNRIQGLEAIDDNLQAQEERFGDIPGIDPVDLRGDGDDERFDDEFTAVIPGVSGFWRTGWNGSGTWSRHLTEVFTIKADVLSQVTRSHLVKGGFEFRVNRLNQQQIDNGGNKVPSRLINPPDDGPFITSGALRDFYDREPGNFSVYIQDKIEFESLIVNVGLRFDNFSPGSEVFEINEAFQTEVTEKEVINDKRYLSPRLGISHPITDRSTLYFFYGRFVQIPTLRQLYRRQNRFRIFQNQLNTYGNPDLEAEETISYEVGFDHQFTDDLKIGVTGFFKDTRNQISTETFGPDAAPFQKFINRDFGSDRGFEIELIKRYSNFVAANINYTLQWANTRASTFREGVLGSPNSDPNIKEVPADWDQRHSINANINFEIPAGQGVQFLGTTLDRVSLTTFIRYGSGLPFTIDEDADPLAIENSERLPYFLTVDLRFRKDFRIARNLFASFYVDVQNLFNRRNLIDLVNDEFHQCVECFINGRGNPPVHFDHGNPRGDGDARDLNPEQFGPPRQILLGFGLRF